MHRSEHQCPNGEAALVTSGERYRAKSLIHKLWQQARILETGMQPPLRTWASRKHSIEDAYC